MDPAVDVEGFSACAFGKVGGDLVGERGSLERWDGNFDHVVESSSCAGGIRRHGVVVLLVYVITLLSR